MPSKDANPVYSFGKTLKKTQCRVHVDIDEANGVALILAMFKHNAHDAKFCSHKDYRRSVSFGACDTSSSAVHVGMESISQIHGDTSSNQL